MAGQRAFLVLAIGDEVGHAVELQAYDAVAKFLELNAAAYGLPDQLDDLDDEQRETLNEAYEQRHVPRFLPTRPASLALPPLHVTLHPSPALSKTVTNFAALCTGERGTQKKGPYKPLSYAKTPIHRIEKGFVLQGGDFTRGDGSGGDSIYGGSLPLEKAGLRPAALDPPLRWGRGTLAMASSASGKSTSQFFISLTDDPAQLKKLDGKYVAFGRVDGPEGWEDTLRAVESRGSTGEKVWIEDCGVL
ncbi:cyclophilin-like protein [Exidia glandulosa HHB12029]|uniref:Peptidyl-prolyl cis-trans isomerase n=1 Tax=Exidia glandulosa HHB12029 TaxID=1314781 RepID=A0A165BXU1_EXIGL|nr:cyclophilin-like protein [Exidia glandulosa HHB12029]